MDLYRLQNGKRKLYLTALIFILLFLTVVRSVHLTADPPSRLSWSGGLYGDEPAYAHNARNKAVFGTWVLDEWNPYLYNPILTFFDYISFKIFGTGFFALRIVALFWGILTLFFVYDTLRRGFEKQPWMPFFGLLMLELNYPFLMYTRLSLSDTMLTNWMLLTLFLWSVGQKNGMARFFTGLSAVAVLSCKPTAIYFAMVVGFTYLFIYLKEESEDKSLRQAVKYLAPFLTGFGLGMAVWFFIYYLPFHREIARYSHQWSKLSMPRSVGDFLDRVLGTHAPMIFKHYAWFPFVLLAGWFYFPISIYRMIKNWRTVNSFELFALLWFGIGYFSLSGFRYRPARYFVSLIPPLVFLALCGLSWLTRLKKQGGFLRSNKVFAVAYLGWIGLTAYLTRKYLHFSRTDLFLAVGIIPGLFIAGLLLNGKQRRRFIPYGIAFGIFILSLGHNIIYDAKWALKPVYQEVTISRKVGTLVKGQIIAGLWAPMACMENNNRALCIAPGWFNDKDPYGKYHFSYLFLWRGNRDAELSMLRRVLGKHFLKSRLKPVIRFNIKDAWAYLFKVLKK